MLKKAVSHLAKWALFMGLLIFLKCSTSQKADLVIYNGNIYTMNEAMPTAGFVAVKDGRIVKIGSAEKAAKWVASAADALDLQGRTMTPGFIEGHGHFVSLGRSKMELDLNGTKSYDEITAKVAEAVKNAKPGEWIQGRGWHQSKWEKMPDKMVRGFQTHDALSAVSPENPVFLRHASGHAGIANAKAMEIAGITAESKVVGGEVLRDSRGNPTGIFVDNAMDLIWEHIPKTSPEMIRKAVDFATAECLSNGITTFHDAGASSSEIAIYKEFLNDGKLKARLYVMLAGWEDGLLESWFQNGPEVGLGNHFLTIRSIKLSSDGALGSRSAWLLEPYSDRPGHYGSATISMETVLQTAKDALQHGFQLCTHAIGDRANREVLNQYEQAFAEFPEQSKNARFRIEHAQHLSAQDIPRFGKLGVIAAMQSIHMASDRPWAIDRLGKARIEEGAYVWQKLLQSGAKIMNGTDVPVEPVNPIAGFYAAVTRRTLSGNPPGGYEPSQKMTRAQALRSYTLDAAFGGFEENLKGSIEAGKLADFTVFSQDIMTVPEDQLLDTKVDFTIVDGEIAFRRN